MNHVVSGVHYVEVEIAPHRWVTISSGGDYWFGTGYVDTKATAWLKAHDKLKERQRNDPERNYRMITKQDTPK